MFINNGFYFLPWNCRGVETWLCYSALYILPKWKLYPKGCVKKTYLLCFLNNFLIFKYFLKKIYRDMTYYISKQHVIIIIIKSEEILVLTEGTWYLSTPALLKHVCTDNFVQDKAISIKNEKVMKKIHKR